MRIRILLLGLLATAVSAAAPGIALAVNTCNGLITIDYVSGPDFALPGDIVRVKLTLGTGSIQGGTKLNVNRLRFDLDCDSGFTLGVPCTDEGSKVEYEGDSTISTTCGVTWMTGHAVGETPNEVVFTASSPVMISANQTIPPGFCALEFDVKVLTRSTDATPNEIEETTGYLAAQNDARCDNGLTSTGQQSSSIPLCPDCNDNIECSQDMCDQSTGMCSHTPVADSTPCTDTDNDACTTAGCNGTLATGGSVTDGCDQNHMVKTCPDDSNPCTGPPTCNPQTGNCNFPNVPDSTPCPDTDGDACTTAGCDGNGVCDQSHILCVTTTTTVPPTTTTTVQGCIPTGPENCGDMIDNDCNGLVDCADPACLPPVCSGGPHDGEDCATCGSAKRPPSARACTHSGGTCLCGPLCKDPTTIKFGPPGAGLDQFKSHGRASLPISADVMGAEVAWLLTNANGPIYRAALPPGALTPYLAGDRFTYTNPDAKIHGGIYKLLIKISGYGESYGYRIEAYGDMSRATDPLMSLQFYIANQPTPTIHTEIWKRTSWGWVAHGFSL